LPGRLAVAGHGGRERVGGGHVLRVGPLAGPVEGYGAFHQWRGAVEHAGQLDEPASAPLLVATAGDHLVVGTVQGTGQGAADLAVGAGTAGGQQFAHRGEHRADRSPVGVDWVDAFLD
jgi:hypothetical protein